MHGQQNIKNMTLCIFFFVDPAINTICCVGVLMCRICNVDGVFSARLELNQTSVRLAVPA